MYILSINMWFQKLVRQFFFAIDNVIYNFIPTLYNLLTDIARTSVLSQSAIKDISSRVYNLLAIFMVFKVTFSLIMYVVNPDDFSDKTKGVSKLTTNIVISLTLLILTPYFFSYAYQLQTILLESDDLGTLIFGKTNSDGSSVKSSKFTSAGDTIAYSAMAPFFIPDTSITDLASCKILTTNSGDGEIFNQKCADALSKVSSNNDSNFTSTDVQNYIYGTEAQLLGLTFRQNMVLASSKVSRSSDDSDDESFVMEYRIIFSTAVGVIVVLLLLSFCIDVAVRSVKLAFLQLIAPIPILSYIDPKSGKDGMFKKWYEMCFKTYISLFVRLLALYFAIFIISKIGELSDVINGSYQSNKVVKIFVIVGALMFAKQLPKILEGLGIKLDGDGKFNLNPIKRLEDEAIGGKAITGAAAGLAGGAVGALTGAGVGRALSGGLSGALGKKSFNETWKATKDKNAAMRTARLDGSTMLGRAGARFSNTFGTRGALGRIEQEKHDIQNQMDKIDNQIKSKEDEKNKIKGTDAYRNRELALKQQNAVADLTGKIKQRSIEQVKNGQGAAGRRYQEMMRDVEAFSHLKAGEVYKGRRFNSEAEAAAWSRKISQEAEAFAAGDGWKSYATQVSNGGFSDANITGNQKQLDVALADLGINVAHDSSTYGEELNAQLNAAKNNITDIKVAGSQDEKALYALDSDIASLNEQKATYNDQMRDISKRESIAKANQNAIK